MSEPQLQTRSSDSLPGEEGLAAGEEGGHDRLQALFAEVTALANQLRKMAALVHRQDESPAGGWGILQALDRLGPQNVPGIARMRALSRQNIQTLVNRLESHGYVVLTSNPAHKRSGLVCLTDAGRTLLRTVSVREAASLEHLLPLVPEARLLSATKLLRRLRLLLSGNESPAYELGGGRPARKRTRTVRTPTPHQEPAPVAAEPPEAPEEGQPEEDEFPVNLL